MLRNKAALKKFLTTKTCYKNFSSIEFQAALGIVLWCDVLINIAVNHFGWTY